MKAKTKGLKQLRDEVDALQGVKRPAKGRAPKYGRFERHMSSVLLWTPEVERAFDGEPGKRK